MVVTHTCYGNSRERIYAMQSTVYRLPTSSPVGDLMEYWSTVVLGVQMYWGILLACSYWSTCTTDLERVFVEPVILKIFVSSPPRVHTHDHTSGKKAVTSEDVYSTPKSIFSAPSPLFHPHGIKSHSGKKYIYTTKEPRGRQRREQDN